MPPSSQSSLTLFPGILAQRQGSRSRGIPLSEDVELKGLLRNLVPYKSINPDEICLTVLSELADVTVRLRSVIFERLWSLGEAPTTRERQTLHLIFKKGTRMLRGTPGQSSSLLPLRKVSTKSSW